MKTTLLLLTLFLIASCGQQTSKATLEVTKGFAFSASSFDGGLIIGGVNESTGQRFSSALASGTSTKLTLPNGTWSFYAMGWPTPTMSGTPKCGYTTAKLGGVDTTVSISITDAGCANSVFGPNTSFLLKACSSFYSYSGSSYTAIADGASAAFCSTLPADMQGKSAMSYKFVGFTSSLGASDGSDILSSSCYPVGTAVNWPRLNIPLAVILYEDSTCTSSQQLNRFVFPSGLANGNSNFDSLFFTTSGSSYFALPTNKMRRGYSPFMTMLPKIDCGGECLTPPSTIPGDRWIPWNNSSSPSEIIVATNVSSDACTSATVSGLGSFGSYVSSSCRVDDKSNLYIKVYHDSGLCNTSPCSATATIASPTLSSTSISVWSTGTSSEVNGYGIQNAIWSMVGTRSLVSSQKYFYNTFQYDDENRDYGELSDPRNMLGPDGVGGVLSAVSKTCSDFYSKLPLSRSVTLNEDGQNKTYVVEAQAITTSIPSYILGGATGSSFLLKIYRQTSSKTLIHQMELMCDLAIGHAQNYDLEDYTDKGMYRGKRLFWNTTSPLTARFEKFGIEYKGSDTYRAEVSLFTKSGSLNYFTARRVALESKFNGSMWDQRISIEEFKRENTTSDLISRLSTYDSTSDSSKDTISTTSADSTSDDYENITPSSSECMTTASLSTSLTSLSTSASCSAYSDRSAFSGSLSAIHYRADELAYGLYKPIFPLIPLP